MQRVPMTKEGSEKLREQLAYIKGEKRMKIINAIEEARAHGDLSENAEYHAAKEDQGMNEAKIKDLEDKLARSQVIDPATIESDKVVFGARVTLIDAETEKRSPTRLLGRMRLILKLEKSLLLLRLHAP